MVPHFLLISHTKEMALNNWIQAFRLRTLPLSLSCIGMGNILAWYHEIFSFDIMWLSLLTTVFLQILSNLANDYGDTVFGADNADRKGPDRLVQAGLITPQAMKKVIALFAFLSLVSGLLLLWISDISTNAFIVFLLMGIAAIIAAVSYTISVKKPYGYKGYGDLSVFIFFGPMAVIGTFYLQANFVRPDILLPAATCGFFATGVLNINNIRDIDSDRLAGKASIPVRIGARLSVIYHAFLLFGGFAIAIAYVVMNFHSTYQFLFLITLPLFYKNFIAVKENGSSGTLDPLLKQLAVSTLIFVLVFGLGFALSVFSR